MSSHQFRGSITALVTPFQDGKLDEHAFRKLVEWQIEEGTHGLVPTGTTGESPTLTNEEHHHAIRLTVEQAQGRVPVIAGTGSNNTQEAIELSQYAEKAGADALLVVTPYYNRPDHEGLYQHFRAINDKVGIPIFIYNIPARSVVDMSVETMARCYELSNVIGVKDATGDVARITLQREAMGPDFIQLSGNDLTNLACMAAGAVGSISVVSNVAPRLCAQLHEACLAGDYEEGRRLQDLLTPLGVSLFKEPGVTGTKGALSLMGMCRPDVRLPLMPVTSGTLSLIEAAIKHAGLAYG